MKNHQGKPAKGCTGYADGGEVKNFIAGAIKHPGALRRKASAAGESTSQFAQQHQSDSGTTGRQARLAITLGKMHR